MADQQHYAYGQQQQVVQKQNSEPAGLTQQVVKVGSAATAGGSLLLLSGLTLAGTVIALTIATPLLVIFSPVLVPALIAAALIVTGFAASGGFGVAAITALSWIYRYVRGGHGQPAGADELDQARMKLSNKAREMKNRAEQLSSGAAH